MATPCTKYTLYHDPSSLCSIMVRYASALRGEPADSSSAMEIGEKLCSLQAKEQLTEHFLCEINANGEVPVLVPEDASFEPIPESVDITYEIAKRYPSLLPKSQEREIKRLLQDLHDINFFSLTFAGRPHMQQSNMAVLGSKLAEDISEKYRNAIEHKMHRMRSRKMVAIEPQEVQRNVDKTSAYLSQIAQLVERSNTGWILDTHEPTALDAHLVVFLCRLQDVERESLVPDALRQYRDVAMAQPAWEEVMKGQRTLSAFFSRS